LYVVLKINVFGKSSGDKTENKIAVLVCIPTLALSKSGFGYFLSLYFKAPRACCSTNLIKILNYDLKALIFLSD